ncbi:MAG: histidine kinase dimerization/phospho-acceptor domain-containing protein, partial [Maribacter stanieri]
MPISKTKDLLGQLSQLERTVSEFSFEELSTDEAKVLKNSFNTFRSSLENHIYESKEENILPQKKESVGANDKDISQKQFITHISHEIRTPLNSIIGYANLLNDEGLT